MDAALSRVAQLGIELTLHWNCLGQGEKVEVLTAWAHNDEFARASQSEQAPEGPAAQWLRDTLERMPKAERQTLLAKLDAPQRTTVEGILNDLDPNAALDGPGNGLHQLLLGGGPRSTTQTAAEIGLLFKLEADFLAIMQAGGKYESKTTIVERKDAAWLGRGNAWGPGQTGAANTGAETAGMSLVNRLATYYTENRETLLTKYESENPIAASLLRSAFEGSEAQPGEPVTGRAVLTREDVGFEELLNFARLVDLARTRFPFHKIEIKTGTSAETIDISDADKPKVGLVDAETGKSLGELQADVVRMNTGTTLANPLPDNGSREHAFVQTMHPKALAKFLDDKGLLDSDGKLKTGTSIGLGGTGLSWFDQVTALDKVMGLYEPDPDSLLGHKVSESARTKYQGHLTTISQSDGKFIPPRHSPGLSWTQKSDPLGTTREWHALSLRQQGERLYEDWPVIMDASVALATGKVPSQIAWSGLNTADLMKTYEEGNDKHLATLREARGLEGEAKA